MPQGGRGLPLALVVLAGGLLAAGCAPPAGLRSPTAAVAPAAPLPVVPMPGGWFAASADDRARQAFAEAVRQQAIRSGVELVLVGVDTLEQQVVAGMNYRGDLRVRQETAERRARVSVFRGLDGEVVLRDWEWLSVP